MCALPICEMFAHSVFLTLALIPIMLAIPMNNGYDGLGSIGDVVYRRPVYNSHGHDNVAEEPATIQHQQLSPAAHQCDQPSSAKHVASASTSNAQGSPHVDHGEDPLSKHDRLFLDHHLPFREGGRLRNTNAAVCVVFTSACLQWN